MLAAYPAATAACAVRACGIAARPRFRWRRAHFTLSRLLQRFVRAGLTVVLALDLAAEARARRWRETERDGLFVFTCAALVRLLRHMDVVRHAEATTTSCHAMCARA